MHRNLDAEMARFKIARAHLAKELGVTPTTLSLKLNGKSSLLLNECVRIKRILKTNFLMEYLIADFRQPDVREKCAELEAQLAYVTMMTGIDAEA